MAIARSLWRRSLAWRWTLCLTLLATALVVLTSPWRPLSVANTGSAQFAPSTAPYQGQIAAPPPTPALHNLVDPAFDVAVAIPAVTFSSDTELHVVGVYEGALANGEKEKPWWSNCTGLSDDPSAMSSCHARYAGQSTTKTVSVYVNRTSAPVVLALMAYEPVLWKIVARPATDLQGVILGGYHGQDIEGVSDATPVQVYSYDTSPCTNCTRHPEYFYAYKQDSQEYTKAIKKLEAVTGLVPASFQGAHQSDRFTIVDGKTHAESARSRNQVDPYTGSSYSNHVDVAGKRILLPDGNWQALAYVESPSSRGTDYFLALAQTSNDRISELMVVRLQNAEDNQGFSQYQACSQPADYGKKVNQNEPLGAQLCYWASYVTTPWQQPIHRLTADRLVAKGIKLPETALGKGFHKADKRTSMTTLYYAFPDAHNQSFSATDWRASPWNPAHIDDYPEKERFLKQNLQWAEDWYEFFSAAEWVSIP